MNQFYIVLRPFLSLKPPSLCWLPTHTPNIMKSQHFSNTICPSTFFFLSHFKFNLGSFPSAQLFRSPFTHFRSDLSQHFCGSQQNAFLDCQVLVTLWESFLKQNSPLYWRLSITAQTFLVTSTWPPTPKHKYKENNLYRKKLQSCQMASFLIGLFLALKTLLLVSFITCFYLKIVFLQKKKKIVLGDNLGPFHCG